jgi:hypothetical protein
LVELVMSETVRYECDGLSDSADLTQPLPDSFELLPAVLPEESGCGSAWFLGDEVLAHVYDDAWLTVRARSTEALKAVREGLELHWIVGNEG